MRDYSARQRRRRLPPAAGDTEKLRARCKDKERKMLDLNGKSDCRQIANALREAGAEVPDFDRTFCGERLVSDVAVEHVELPPFAEGGPLDDVTARVEAWVLSWSRRSWSTGRTLRHMVAVIDRSAGGLPAGGDGFATRERFTARLAARGDLEPAMEVVARGCVPVRRGFEEY